jgi:hypothetical protein
MAQITSIPEDRPEGVEVKVFSCFGTVGNQSVLLIEVVEESWTVVTAIAFCEQIETRRLNLRIELRKCTVESLQNFPCSNGSQIGRICTHSPVRPADYCEPTDTYQLRWGR